MQALAATLIQRTLRGFVAARQLETSVFADSHKLKATVHVVTGLVQKNPLQAAQIWQKVMLKYRRFLVPALLNILRLAGSPLSLSDRF
jgi:hypothetical protein